MAVSFLWPRAICRIVADGGDIRKITCEQADNKLRWSYQGKYVCSSKARVISYAPIYQGEKA